MMFYRILSVVMSVYLSACNGKKGFDGMGVFEGDEWVLSSEIGGKIIEINVSEGESVKKGQILKITASIRAW